MTLLRLDAFCRVMGNTMRGRSNLVYRNLSSSAFELTPQEAVLYSEWSKSKVQWSAERRDMARHIVRKYYSMGCESEQVRATLSRINIQVQLSHKALLNTLAGRRAFWSDPAELDTWQKWLNGHLDATGIKSSPMHISLCKL